MTRDRDIAGPIIEQLAGSMIAEARMNAIETFAGGVNQTGMRRQIRDSRRLTIIKDIAEERRLDTMRR